MLCVIGGAVIDTTNKQSVADLSRNDEGVVKNYFCIPKQLEIRNSLVSLFGVTLCYFYLQKRVSRIMLMVSCAAGTFLIPVSCTDTGLVPGPRVTRRHVSCHVSHVTCPVVATIIADTDPEAWPLTYICSGHC